MKVALKVNRTSAAFTLVEIMVVVTIIGLLVAVALPRFMMHRDYARLNVIYTNLRTLETAKEEWALDNKKKNGDPVPDLSVLSEYFRSGTLEDVVQEQYVPNEVGTRAQADLPAGVKLGPWGPGGFIPSP